MNAEIAKTFPQFARLDPGSAHVLDGAARVVTLPAGTPVFHDGSACTSYVLVMEGSVRVQKVSESGREIVLYRVESGQSCVLTTNCLITHGDYTAEGVAETEVKALVVPAFAFRTLLGQSEAFRDFVFSAYATRISDLLMLIEEVAFGRIDLRLAGWLCTHAGTDGAIKATHQDIATELGTAREVVSRQLKDFERRGWVGLFRGRVEVVDPAGLASLHEQGRL
ncbi:Crp/Fnr family transcriptional regulator [Magnetospirillum sp. 64-120]|mgnify:CR=1 FL=1|uniref:Crp/Fnr family transcriptional regulator n=1 Tax=Magnetospirillum sp. 64-120 TaxID=1895778 RepID=UPI000925A690|nr:Crp/Fnr family transcriptional regulator [Magnetospirillum sp. 64-120]OJX80989.1 MAG: Crp/Fnr family transcriptional regulator [Magnetospirillum sp. 64-120]